MVLQLSFSEFLRLRRAKGADIQVLEGEVWITEDGRRDDRFIHAGRSYRVRGPGLVVVGAESPSGGARVEVRAPAPLLQLLQPVQQLQRLARR